MTGGGRHACVHVCVYMYVCVCVRVSVWDGLDATLSCSERGENERDRFGKGTLLGSSAREVCDYR